MIRSLLRLNPIGMPRMLSVCAVGLTFACALPTTVEAGEKGKFKGKSVLVITQFHEIKTPEDNPAKSVQIGEWDGVVFNEAGKAFLDNARYQGVWKGDGRGAGECFKTFTSEAGQVFVSCVGQAQADGSDEGTLVLTGGTGAYKGIKGKGTYRLKMVADRVMWDILEWEYEIP
jgi:hypothetical protein